MKKYSILFSIIILAFVGHSCHKSQFPNTVYNIQPEELPYVVEQNITFSELTWPDELSQHCLWEIRGFIDNTPNVLQNDPPFNCVPYIKFENLINTSSPQPKLTILIHSCISDYLVPTNLEGKYFYVYPIEIYSENSVFKKRAVFENQLINFLSNTELKYTIAGVNLELKNKDGKRLLLERQEIIEQPYRCPSIHENPQEDRKIEYPKQKKVITNLYLTKPPIIKEIIVDE